MDNLPQAITARHSTRNGSIDHCSWPYLKSTNEWRGNLVRVRILLAALASLTSTAAFSDGSWFGYLVNSDCYESASGNVSPWSTATVDRDMDWSIKYCAPDAKTKSFGLVRQDWQMFKLDPAGNTKAAEFIQKTGKRKRHLITITGETEKKILKVDTISSTD
jgi:hypothetical protein